MRTIFLLVICCVLGACVAVPRLDMNGIAVSQVVERIKCELAVSLPDVRGEYNPAKKFHWMKYWTAKVDLELQTTETGTVTPSASYIDPSANFTLGFGGNLRTEAYRSDNMSFTLSVNELMDLAHSEACNFSRGLGLLGHLGLEEWISSALTPVENRVLTVGYHQTPGKTAQLVGPIEKGSSKEKEPRFAMDRTSKKDDDKDKIDKKLDRAEVSTDTARIAAINARKTALRKKTQETYVYARTAADKAEVAEGHLEVAKVMIWQFKRQYDVWDVKDPPLETWSARLKEIGEQVSTAKNSAAAAWELLPRDAPLDSIAHTAKFTVNAGLNATPNWTLARFRGPGLSNPFASVQRLRVHELTIVLGAPATPGGKDLSAEQARQLLNAKINTRGFVILTP